MSDDMSAAGLSRRRLLSETADARDGDGFLEGFQHADVDHPKIIMTFSPAPERYLKSSVHAFRRSTPLKIRREFFRGGTPWLSGCPR